MRKSLNAFLGIMILLSIASTAAMADTTGSAPAAGVVNLNTADASQIAMLPRVGSKAAQRVVEYRAQHGAFKSISDLMQVKGFGEKTLSRLNPYLTLDGKTTLSAKVKGPRKARARKSSKSPTNTAK